MTQTSTSSAKNSSTTTTQKKAAVTKQQSSEPIPFSSSVMPPTVGEIAKRFPIPRRIGKKKSKELNECFFCFVSELKHVCEL